MPTKDAPQRPIAPTGLEWHEHGEFRWAKKGSVLLARLPFFDEAFRDFARSQRVRWAPIEKAWAFPVAKEVEVLASLSKLNRERQEHAQSVQGLEAESRAKLNAEPFSFDGHKLKISYDKEQGHFRVKFPYDEELGQKMRRMGGRWNPELKCHVAPAAALPALVELTEPSRREQARFEARNAIWADKELLDPLGTWVAAHAPGPAKEGWHEIRVEADLEGKVYVVKLPFDMESKLGRELLRPVFEQTGAFDFVCAQDVERAYPLIRHASSVFELCQRPQLETALAAACAALAGLGPFEKFEVAADSAEGRRLRDVRADPSNGDVMLRGSEAWLISKTLKGKSKIVLWSHKISARSAKERVEAEGPYARRRCCDASGIDFESYDAYVEALFLRESVQSPRVKIQGAKPMRL